MTPLTGSSADAEHISLLATWPTEGDAAGYARLLADDLLSRHRRLLIETSVLIYSLRHPNDPKLVLPHHEAKARLWFDGRLAHEAIAYGPNPYAAKANAELFVLRSAVLCCQDVPVLGRLFTRDPVTLDLSLRGRRYWVSIRLARPHASWFGGVTLTRTEYEMPAYITPYDPTTGTRYMRLKHVDDEIKRLVKPYMDVGQTVYLHRFILALGGHPVSRVRELNALRRELGLHEFKGKLREGHHVDGQGLNNRQSNLRPLQPHVHQALHGGTPQSFKDTLFSNLVSSPSDPLLWLPRPTLVTPYGVLGQAGHDRIWRNFEVESSDESPVLAPPSWQSPPLPITRAEIAGIARNKQHERTFLQALKSLEEAEGQSMFRFLKKTATGTEMKGTTLRDALNRLAELGLVGRESLGGGSPVQARAMSGVETHYRLLRPFQRGFFNRFPC